MVVIHLFLMLCDLQRVVRDLCPTLYMELVHLCSVKVFVKQQCINTLSRSYEDKVSTVKLFLISLQYAKSSLCVDISGSAFLY
jgi:hypothetical protein